MKKLFVICWLVVALCVHASSGMAETDAYTTPWCKQYGDAIERLSNDILKIGYVSGDGWVSKVSKEELYYEKLETYKGTARITSMRITSSGKKLTITITPSTTTPDCNVAVNLVDEGVGFFLPEKVQSSCPIPNPARLFSNLSCKPLSAFISNFANQSQTNNQGPSQTKVKK